MTRSAFLILLWSVMARPLAAQAVLPALIGQQLSRTFPGWHFATLGADDSTSLPANASPAWIHGDFDGDTHADYVVQVVTTEGPDSLQRVIAFLGRRDGYMAVLVDSFPVSTTAYLVLAPAGEERTDFDADPNGRTHVRLQHDAVDIVFAEAAASTCLYRSARFRCMTSGD